MLAGHEFCLELRKTVPDAVVPVIMVSAKNDEANIVEGLTHGCNDFVRCGTAITACKLNAVVYLAWYSHPPASHCYASASFAYS